VLYTVDVSGGKVWGNASVWQLSRGRESDEKRGKRSVKVLHVYCLMVNRFLSYKG